MLVRFLMVGLVTCLGLDGPGQCLMRREAPSRCVWCEGPAAVTPSPTATREAAPMPEGPDAFATTETVPPAATEPDPDAAFGLALTATLGTFAADLASLAEPEPAEAAVSVASSEVVEPELAFEAAVVTFPEDDFYPGLAYALNRQAEGLTAVEAPSVGPADAASEPASMDLTIGVEPRSERFQAAVRLTGQAVHAWLSVLQAPALACEAEGSTVSR